MPFVPRLNLHHKPYKHVVALGETPQQIAEKHGAGPQGYRELLAANLPRATRPMGLGSPSGSVTFDSLEEGESLAIPSHWPELAVVRTLSGVPGALGAAPVLDATNPIFVAASDSAHKQFDDVLKGEKSADADAYLASVLNAAVQWYSNQADLSKPIDTALMDRLAYNAGIWTEAFGSALAPQQAGKLAWGPFGMLLSDKPIAWDTIDWTGGGGAASPPAPAAPAGFAPSVKAPTGLPADADWSWIPWDLVGQNSVYLDSAPATAPVSYPSPVDQAGAQAAWESAIKDAISGVVSPPQDCQDGYRHADLNDSTTPCVSICSDPAMWDPDRKQCCPLGSAYSATLKTCDCGAGNTYDSAKNTCSSGQPIVVKKDDAAPAKKTSYVVPVVIGVGVIGTALWFGRDMIFGKKKTE